MRDHNFDSAGFVESVNTLSETYLFQFSEVLPRITPSALNENFENRFKIIDRSLENLVVLAILSWYFPEEIGILLRLEISDLLNTDLYFLEILLKSKGHCILYLQDTSLWHSRDFFGNILTKKNIKKALLSIRPIYKSKRKPKRVQRRRGYRDKGTLRLESDKHDLWYSSVQQMQTEEFRESLNDQLLLLEGFIT